MYQQNDDRIYPSLTSEVNALSEEVKDLDKKIEKQKKRCEIARTVQKIKKIAMMTGVIVVGLVIPVLICAGLMVGIGGFGGFFLGLFIGVLAVGASLKATICVTNLIYSNVPGSYDHVECNARAELSKLENSRSVKINKLKDWFRSLSQISKNVNDSASKNKELRRQLQVRKKLPEKSENVVQLGKNIVSAVETGTENLSEINKTTRNQ